MIVSSDGYVLTNNHVIGNARADVRVTLWDGREHQARLVGVDDVTDLAVVKIDAHGLPTLPWGDSNKLRVAQWVLAIGNPFQLSGTVTLGIVSTVSRPGTQVGAFSDSYIQTDAAINPGNSGGALVNARGELVGINSMIYSETGGYQGIGFAIPANLAHQIMQELISNPNHEVRWGSLGDIRWRAVSQDVAEYNGLGNSAGVMVWALSPTSSAARAGLRRGDLVVAVNDTTTPDEDALNRVIIKSHIGSTAKLHIIRGGRRMTLDVPVQAR